MEMFFSFSNATHDIFTPNSTVTLTLTLTVTLVAIAIVAYVKYVHYKRKIITDDFLDQIPSPSNMEEAHKLVGKFTYQDFPFLATKSLEFGLFKTYGIPSISSILCQDGELIFQVNKRYDDTDIIIREIIEHNFSSKRSQAALKRLNFIHSHYKISNRDYLYVLAIFIVEPIVWAEKFGYRAPHPKEKVAMHLYWKCIGEQMGIQDIPNSYEQTLQYCESYEQRYMRYNESNVRLAKSTFELLLSKAPFPSLHPKYLHPVIHALCPQLLREAMGFPVNLPHTLVFVVEHLLHLHSFLVRHFVLPKSKWVTRTSANDDDYLASSHCRCSRKLFTNFNQYENTYKHGYLIEELGPIKFCPRKM